MSVDVTSWSLPTGIQLADPSFYDPGSIDVVLGAEVFFDLFKASGRISLGDTLPTLVNSVFGWIVSGKVSEGAPRSAFVCNVASTADLHNDMERFWAIEDEPTTAYSPEEALCGKIFSETVTRDSDGRYVVRLPLKRNLLDNLGDNRRSALHRYRLIENRLGRDPGLATEYRKFMDEYFQLGHMERIDENNASSQAFFLPHHPVIRAESSTTKVRVVFDASCKSATGRSLNDVMLVGPTVQQDWRSIIIRSRLHPIMLIADITKMYRQIRLHPGDTHLQRTPDEPIGVYELKTVTYGTASAPFLATRVVSQLATDEKCHYPLAAEVACKDFYVDDLFTGAKTVNEAIELRKQMEAMFNSAGMKLRKWASNVPASLQDVPEENRAIKDLVDFDKDQSIKTLGLHWEPQTDRLKYVIPNITIDRESAVTKRNTLSSVAKLFDPLGLVGCGVLRTATTHDCDQELPENLFSDASETAYGVYVKSTNSSGQTKTALLTSRSKVAPPKQISIPRLELRGARSAAELYGKVSDSLRIDARIHFWVYSTTVLSWLQARPLTWTTFVANRVATIQRLTQNCEWHFVHGVENPADIISRGLPADELASCKVWWEGPTWLRKSSEFWPTSPLETQSNPECSREVRKTAHIATSQPDSSFIDEYIALFSSYSRLVRTTAYWRRLSTVLRTPRAERKMFEPLTLSELQGAEFALIRCVQQAAFPEEWKTLYKN
ncbi:uncharacterized protein LOC129728911 [Wyeomyia smithii]|uniref:uncharacterized protein LOC129728911 n=1 Tax=Wyeomyia smithii TaxID=174621 RepID=UPI002467ACC9|nr:uncharacterized protein LOC129728911 [Wyeomyia smithii]